MIPLLRICIVTFVLFMFSGMLIVFVIILVFLQQIEIWKESEDGVLDISIKLYVMKDTHMVSWFVATFI